MRRAADSTVLTVACLVLAVAAASCRDITTRTSGPLPETPPQRIVSMAPSLTEVLFALGVGDRVVGVTRYCDYPPAAQTRTKIGGYLDPNWETLVALEPDLVVLMQGHDQARARLRALAIPTIQVDHSSIDGILDSVTVLGRACGLEKRGSKLAERLRWRLDEIALLTRDLAPPRVLVVVGRQPGSGSVSTLWAAAPGTFYHDILELAGGVNVCQSSALPYPELSREGLLHLDPDVILDVVPEISRLHLDPEVVRDDWQSLPQLRAVDSGRVHVLDQGFVEIPGPRVVDTVATFARLLHPEIQGMPS